MMTDLLIFLKKYKYHFLAWGIYLTYEIVFLWLLLGAFATPGAYVFTYFFYILSFYFHAEILLKYTLESPNKLFKYSLPLLILIEILLFVYIKQQSDLLFYKNSDTSDLKGYEFCITSLSTITYRFIYFMFYGTGYYFLLRIRKQRQLVEEMEEQELKNLILEKEIKSELVITQNTFLRSQINPDFLINTLAYLYNETLESAPTAAESIQSLSDIMQYALSKEASSGFVKLEKEISLIENFLLLHQARQVNQAQLKFTYNKESLAMDFIPLILMTLTENILKHGQLNDPERPAEIKINYANSILSIETSNRQITNSALPSYGIGVKNIKDRLSIAYGEAATFDYYLDPQRNFHASIQVRIQNSSSKTNMSHLQVPHI